MRRSAIQWFAPVPLLLSAGTAAAQPAAPADETGQAPQSSRLVTIAIDLDERGKVTNCAVTASSGVKELDEASCRAVREQGKYEPVLDDDGKGMAATIVHTLTWRLGDDDKRLAERGQEQHRAR